MRTIAGVSMVKCKHLSPHNALETIGGVHRNKPVANQACQLSNATITHTARGPQTGGTAPVVGLACFFCGRHLEEG